MPAASRAASQSGKLRTLIQRFATERRERSTRTQRDDRALRRASDYLRDRPELNIGLVELVAVAAMTGFADQSHLHRHFQRSLGVTPGEYQRRVMG
ncbi:MAG TPA: helix-turn-helix domain-containing protein [Solirubrobacteraceae bacterium]